MTNNLKKELMQNNNISIIENSKFIKFFSLETKKKLASKLIKRVYAPTETVFDQDSEALKLYLIKEGQVDEYCFDLVHSNSAVNKKKIAKYDPNDNTIGWNNIVTGLKYTSCTKADKYALLYEIEQEDFVNSIKENKSDFTKFNETK